MTTLMAENNLYLEQFAQFERAQRDLPYSSLDVERGVQHLQLMGVRYYMALTPGAKSAADDNKDLSYLRDSGPWSIYEVAGSDLVQAVDYEPVVVADVGPRQKEWLAPAAAYYNDPTRWKVLLAGDGPPSWERVELGLTPEKRAEIVRKSIYWQCAELIPKLATRTFQIRMPDATSSARAGGAIDQRVNRQLIRLISTMWARRHVMGDLCARILGEKSGHPLRVAGCYFAATGPNRNSQGFLAELFAQIFEGQNFVCWTPEAIQSEKSLMRIVYAGYAFTAVVVAATALASVS